MYTYDIKREGESEGDLAHISMQICAACPRCGPGFSLGEQDWPFISWKVVVMCVGFCFRQVLFPSANSLEARQMIFDFVGGPSSDTVLFWQRLPLWSTSYEDSIGEWRLDGYGEEAERLGEFGKALFSDMLTLCPDHRPSASALLEYNFFNKEVMADGRSIRHEGKDALEGGRSIRHERKDALEGGRSSRHNSASQWSHLQGMVEQDGFAVVPQHVPSELAEKCVMDIRAQVQACLVGYGMKGLHGDAVFEGLLQAVPKFQQTPTGWEGKPFGAIDKRGWQKGLGSGRVFEDWETDAIQQACFSKVGSSN